MIGEEELARLREVLEGWAEVAFAYVFGSAATGRAHGRSDVDIALGLTTDGERPPSSGVHHGDHEVVFVCIDASEVHGWPPAWGARRSPDWRRPTMGQTRPRGEASRPYTIKRQGLTGADAAADQPQSR